MSEVFQSECENGMDVAKYITENAALREENDALKGIIKSLVETAADYTEDSVLLAATSLCGIDYVIKCKIAKGAELTDEEFLRVDNLLGELKIERL